MRDIISAGLTNTNTDDYGTFATAKERTAYKYYCTSHSCCTFKAIRKIKKKDGSVEERWSNVRKPKALVAETMRDLSTCPNCGHTIFARK